MNTPETEITQHGVCFADWLNKIDARIDYDVRRNSGSVREWRIAYDKGHSAQSAIDVIVNHSDFL